jgi:metal-responsive CopG/Arc/MetJ family transcriptional regulator
LSARDGKKVHLVTVRLSEQTMRDVEREADRQERTRSDVIRRLVERSLDCKRASC